MQVSAPCNPNLARAPLHFALQHAFIATNHPELLLFSIVKYSLMFDRGITAADDEPVLLRCYMHHLRHFVDIDTLPHEEFHNMKVTALSSQHQAVHPGLHTSRDGVLFSSPDVVPRSVCNLDQVQARGLASTASSEARLQVPKHPE